MKTSENPQISLASQSPKKGGKKHRHLDTKVKKQKDQKQNTYYIPT